MRKYLILLLIPFLIGAAPTRTNTYTTGTTIRASDVTSNEDAIFTYLQGGVDVIKDGSIINADIKSSAGIVDEKLDLATIAQAVKFNGALTIGATTTFAGQTITDLGTVTTADINAGTWQGTIDGNWTAAGQTVADLGTVTTANIDGGTLDGVQVGGTSNEGELLVNNASNAADGLGDQGTTGEFLKSAGAGASPIWASVGVQTPSSVTPTGASQSTPTMTIAADNMYLLVWRLTADDDANGTVGIRFHSDTGNDYHYFYESIDDAGTEVNGNSAAASSVITGPAMKASEPGNAIWGHAYISNKPGDGTLWMVTGQATSVDNDGNYWISNFGGQYDDQTATSVEIWHSGDQWENVGAAYLYQLGE